jgi:hypothetical protein
VSEMEGPHFGGPSNAKCQAGGGRLVVDGDDHDE